MKSFCEWLEIINEDTYSGFNLQKAKPWLHLFFYASIPNGIDKNIFLRDMDKKTLKSFFMLYFKIHLCKDEIVNKKWINFDEKPKDEYTKFKNLIRGKFKTTTEIASNILQLFNNNRLTEEQVENALKIFKQNFAIAIAYHLILNAKDIKILQRVCKFLEEHKEKFNQQSLIHCVKKIILDTDLPITSYCESLFRYVRDLESFYLTEEEKKIIKTQKNYLIPPKKKLNEDVEFDFLYDLLESNDLTDIITEALEDFKYLVKIHVKRIFRYYDPQKIKEIENEIVKNISDFLKNYSSEILTFVFLKIKENPPN